MSPDTDIDPKAELAELLHKLVNGELQERIEARTAILKFDHEAVEPLIDLLKESGNHQLWWLIADALGRIGDNRAVEPLVKMLQSPLSFDAILARKYAAWALGALNDPRAVDALLGMLNDRSYEEDDEGTIIVDEPDIETIEAAIWALTEIGELRALEPILERITDDCYVVPGSALTEWGEPALSLLFDRLQSKDENQRAIAASLLGEFGDVQAVPHLIEMLKHDLSDDVRHSAAYALSELCDPRAFDALLAALDDPYEQTRAYAAMGLGNLKDVRAVDALRKAVQDEHPVVQHFANSALVSITGGNDVPF